jgi:spermidine synthase
MSNNIFNETLYKTYRQSFDIEEILFEKKTEHQHLIIFKNKMFGNVMVLDGVVQTTEKDEFFYHEMMAHVPILSHGNAKKILVIGGGDGGVIREVIKHDIESVVLVEIDSSVVEMGKKYFPKHSNGAFDDLRVKIIIQDGKDFMQKAVELGEKFDVIISDSTDPIGPAECLFESEFYKNCSKVLGKNGVFVAQNGVSYMQEDEVLTSNRRLKKYFSDTSFYRVAVPTYIGGDMTLAWSSNNPNLRKTTLETLKKRYIKKSLNTKFYNPQIHQASFALPNYILDVCK